MVCRNTKNKREITKCDQNMKIAICESHAQDKMVLQQYFDRMNDDTPADVHFFTCGETLLSSILTGSQYDIYMVTDGLPGVAGFNLIALLQKIVENPVVVMVSGTPQQIYWAFCAKCAQFLFKPLHESAFVSAMESLMKQRTRRQFAFTGVQGDLHILWSCIIGVEFYLGSMKITTCNRVYEVKVRTPPKIKQQLCEQGFIRSHQSFFINPNFVEEISGYWVSCKGKWNFPISVHKKSNFLSEYSCFLEDLNIPRIGIPRGTRRERMRRSAAYGYT